MKILSKRRKKDDNSYEATTWQIKFKLDTVDQNATYKLRIALATANVAELEARNLFIFTIFFSSSCYLFSMKN